MHVDSIEMARSLVREWPQKAERLARLYWPGPLTLVLPKQAHVPDRLTAGLDTVGVRMPSNRIALELIKEAGVPLAAPSANLFSQLSPTTAQHVRESLGERVAMILDGGPTLLGIESTVLSLAGPEAVLLRPGMVSRAQIEDVIGPVEVMRWPGEEAAHPSPGMHARHYSPRTPLALVSRGRLPAGGRGAYLWLECRAECSAMHSDAQRRRSLRSRALSDSARSGRAGLGLDRCRTASLGCVLGCDS